MIHELQEIVLELRQTADNCLERALLPEVKGTYGARTLRARALDMSVLAARLENLYSDDPETSE